MTGHIHPDVRTVLSTSAYGVSEIRPWHDTGAVVVAHGLKYSGVRKLNKAGYTVGGLFTHRSLDGVKFYVEPPRN